MEFATTPNYSNGTFFGPTSEAAGPYPLGAYLTLAEYQKWQVYAQLVNYQASSTAFANAESAFGLTAANPYTPFIAALEAQIAAFPPAQ